MAAICTRSVALGRPHKGYRLGVICLYVVVVVGGLLHNLRITGKLVVECVVL